MTSPPHNRFINILIVANIVSLLLAALGGIDQGNQIFLGIAGGQAAMLGAYLACAYQPFTSRIRWFFRLMVIQWICLTVPFLSDKLHWQFPWCVLADQLLFALPAFLFMGTVRFISRCGVISDNIAPKSTSNYRILDLIIMTTLVALVIGIAMRFTEEPTGWEGLLYAVMIVCGIYVGGSVGCILPLMLAGFLTVSKRTIMLTALMSFIVLGIGPYILVINNEMEKEAIYAILELSVVGLLVALVNTFAFRWYGYRHRKLPRSRAISPLEMPKSPETRQRLTS